MARSAARPIERTFHRHSGVAHINRVPELLSCELSRKPKERS